jgi:hypothetical protein
MRDCTLATVPPPDNVLVNENRFKVEVSVRSGLFPDATKTPPDVRSTVLRRKPVYGTGAEIDFKKQLLVHTWPLDATV